MNQTDYFVHDAACSDSKDLPKTTISNKILKVRADEIARNRNLVGIEEPQQVFSISFLKKKTWSGVSVNEQLAGEFHNRRKTKQVSCDSKCKFKSTTCNSNQKWNNKICNVNVRVIISTKNITLEILVHVFKKYF